MKECKVCGDKTEVVFNIDFKATPICESCATAIFLQQAKWYTETQVEKLGQSEELPDKGRYCYDCGSYVGEGCDNLDCKDFKG